MSQQRTKKWDERALTYLGLPAERRAEFRAQFRKPQFDAAMVRIAARLRAQQEERARKG